MISSKLSRRLLLGAGMLGAAGVLLLATDADARRPWWRPAPTEQLSVSVELEDAAGNPLRTFSHHGRTFVLGDMGERYVVRIANHGSRRLEAVLSVDGRDAVSGRTDDPAHNRGYVVAPFSSVRVDGFRTSLDSVAAFRFTDPSDSYAERLGSSSDIGSIRVAFFQERERPVVAREDRRWRNRRPSAKAASAPGRGSADSAAESGNLGTEFGESRESHVSETRFERRSPRHPERVLTVVYDDAEGLQARGIEVFPRRRWSDWNGAVEGDSRGRWAQPPPGF